MKYKYYGTAASEGIPAVWCDCDVCRRAAQKGGRNIMTRSQQTIDDKVLIDFSADTYMHILRGLPIRQIHTCIITHNHADHFYPADIMSRFGNFAYIDDPTPFSIYAMKPAIEILDKKISENAFTKLTPDRVKLNTIVPFESYTAEGYTITPLRADHDPNSGCVIYLIEKDGKCVLHANDTGYFTEDTWDFLAKNPRHIDFATFDCTEPGSQPGNKTLNWHMNYPTVKNVREKLIKTGLTDNNTIYVINHFSHNGKYIYDELLELAGADGFLVSYDGMEIEF